MHEDIICEKCRDNVWTNETTCEKWITCKCGHQQEIFTSKQLDEINRHKGE